ncbi:substrate-binding domain-containing protein [Streptomyces sp. NPDC006476]|uniref:substrate-binding domain-containing protein n=1 Tax=Streptomyces sp. NPDC006476 TaxID=3157175 RepID=UPI0033A33E7D
MSPAGRRPTDHDPATGPLSALAWALTARRNAQGLSLEQLASATSYDKTTLSRVTNATTLPSEGPYEAFARGCGLDVQEWKQLRLLAGHAAAELGPQALRRFADALVSACTVLPQASRQQLGEADGLVTAWNAALVPAQDLLYEREEDPTPSMEHGQQCEGLAAGASATAASSASVPGSDESLPPDPGRHPVPGARKGRAPDSTPGNMSGQTASMSWYRRRSTRLAGVALAAAAVVVGVFVPGCSHHPQSGLAGCSKPTQTLRVAASTDKAAIVHDVADAYGPHVSHGQCVRVAVDGVDSGTAMRALADGWNTAVDGPRPDVWSPASHIWLQMARARAKKNHRPRELEQLPASLPTGSSLVVSPLTIAMPEPAARKLGWPKATISWQDLAAMAARPGFKLGKTNPEYSTSGLNATFASFYAQTGTSSELTTTNLHDPTLQKKVARMETSVVHYGDTTLTYLANLRRFDDAGQASAYLSAVTVEENSVVAYNLGYPCGSRSSEPGCEKTTPPHTKLLAFHPVDDGIGTIYSDHPYIPLQHLTPAKKTIATSFRAFLDTKTAQTKFADLGFRTPTGGLTPHITAGNGIPGERLPAPLGQPTDDVLTDLPAVWRELRKPANVLLLIDTSGSMDFNAQGKQRVVPTEKSKLDLVKDAQGALLDGFTPADKVGLWHFSDHHTVDDPIAPMDSKKPDGTSQREHLATDIGHLHKDAGTALYATVDDGVDALRHHYDPHAINAVVVLTDGCDQTRTPGPGLEQLTTTLADPNQPPIRVFPIAYGQDACRPQLKATADASHAHAYNAQDPNTIDNVLTNVISNF